MPQSKKRPSLLSSIDHHQAVELGLPANKRRQTPNGRKAAGAVVPTAGLMMRSHQSPLQEVPFAAENLVNNTNADNVTIGDAALLLELKHTQKRQKVGPEKEAVTPKKPAGILKAAAAAAADLANVEIFFGRDVVDKDYAGNMMLLYEIHKMVPAFAFEKRYSDRLAYAERLVDELRSQHSARFLRFKKQVSKKEPNNNTCEMEREDAVTWVYMKLKDATLRSGLGNTAVIYELLCESKADLSLSTENIIAMKKLSGSQRKKLAGLLRLHINDAGQALNYIEIPPFLSSSSPTPDSTTDGRRGRTTPEFPKKEDSDKNSNTSPGMAEVLAHGLHEKKEPEAHESEPEDPSLSSSRTPNSTTDGRQGRSPPEPPKKQDSDKNSNISPSMANVLAHELHEKNEPEAHESEPEDPSFLVARRMSVTSHDDDAGSDTDELTVSSAKTSVASVPSYEDSRLDPTSLLRHMSGMSLVDNDDVIASETDDDIDQAVEFGLPVKRPRQTPNASRNVEAVVPTAGLMMRSQPPLQEVSFAAENLVNNTNADNATIGDASLLLELKHTRKRQKVGPEKEAVTPKKPVGTLKAAVQAADDLPNVEILFGRDVVDKDYAGNMLLLDWIHKMVPAFAFEKRYSDRLVYAERLVDQLCSQHNARFLRFKKQVSKETNNSTCEMEREDAVTLVYMKLKDATLRSGLGNTAVIYELLCESKADLSLPTENIIAMKKLSGSQRKKLAGLLRLHYDAGEASNYIEIPPFLSSSSPTPDSTTDGRRGRTTPEFPKKEDSDKNSNTSPGMAEALAHGLHEKREPEAHESEPEDPSFLSSSRTPNSTTDGRQGRSPPEPPKKQDSDKNSNTFPSMAEVLAHGLYKKKEPEAHESEPEDSSFLVARRKSVTSYDQDSGSDTDKLAASSSKTSVDSFPPYEDSRTDPTSLLRRLPSMSLVDDDIASETEDEPCLNEKSSPEASEATPCYINENDCVQYTRQENSMDENSLFGIAPASSLYSDEKAQLLASLDLDETLVSGVDGKKIEFCSSLLLSPTDLSRSTSSSSCSFTSRLLLSPTDLSRSTSSSSCSFTSRLLSMASPFARGRGSDFEQTF